MEQCIYRESRQNIGQPPCQGKAKSTARTNTFRLSRHDLKESLKTDSTGLWTGFLCEFYQTAIKTKRLF